MDVPTANQMSSSKEDVDTLQLKVVELEAALAKSDQRFNDLSTKAKEEQEATSRVKELEGKLMEAEKQRQAGVLHLEALEVCYRVPCTVLDP